MPLAGHPVVLISLNPHCPRQRIAPEGVIRPGVEPVGVAGHAARDDEGQRPDVIEGGHHLHRLRILHLVIRPRQRHTTRDLLDQPRQDQAVLAARERDVGHPARRERLANTANGLGNLALVSVSACVFEAQDAPRLWTSGAHQAYPGGYNATSGNSESAITSWYAVRSFVWMYTTPSMASLPDRTKLASCVSSSATRSG